MYDVIVLGDYFFDQIFSGLPQFPALGREIYCGGLTTTGGAMFITAATLTRLGAHVGWPAHFGNDYYSGSIIDLAEREGVDLSLMKKLDRPYRRVTTAMPFAGDRAFVTFTDPDEDPHDHWLTVLQRERYRHVHIGGLMALDQARPLIDAAHAQNATVSMDCHDSPMLDKPCACRDVIPLLDIFMPNRREALIVAERDSIEAALDVFMPLAPTIVIKDGENGCYVGHDAEVIHVPGITAGACVDTTGAGDCFNAGFVYGYAVEGASLAQSARYANICGGLSVTGPGGATTAPTYAELRAWLDDNPV